MTNAPSKPELYIEEIERLARAVVRQADFVTWCADRALKTGVPPDELVLAALEASLKDLEKALPAIERAKDQVGRVFVRAAENTHMCASRVQKIKQNQKVAKK